MDTKGVSPLLVLLLFLLSHTSLCSAQDTDIRIGRELQQRQTDVQITTENVNLLAASVRDAASNTTFVFVANVQLPSAITVTASNLTFRGEENLRPSIVCADGEEGFIINADNVVFDNLILRNCTKTAVRIFDDAEECSPFDADCVEPETQSIVSTFRRVDFISNNVTSETNAAGAVSAEDKTRLHIESCTFEGNEGGSGASVSFRGDSLVVKDCMFLQNVAERIGGAIHAQTTDQADVRSRDVRVEISNCGFANNSVLMGGRDPQELGGSTRVEADPFLVIPLPSPSGGAVFIDGFAEVVIRDCNFTGNSAVPAGGAIYLGDSNEITIDGCRFENNRALPNNRSARDAGLQLGGAIFAAFASSSSRLSISASVFVENTATYGGGLHVVAPVESRTSMRRCTFTRNVASLGGGGAVFRNVERPMIDTTSFLSNSASFGGAVFATNGAGVSIDPGTIFEDNTACDGGALFGIGGGLLQLTNATFRRNQAQRNGGAVCYVDSKAEGSLSIVNGRMLSNSAENGGAIFLESVTKFSMHATADVNLRFVTDETPRNDFINNTAVAGGAIYYRASNLVGNQFTIDRANFNSNQAVANVSLVFGEQLILPDVCGGTIELPRVDVEGGDRSNGRLLDLHGIRPCHPGGGGGICFELFGLSDRAPTNVDVIRSNFSENSAAAGGAILVSTEENSIWRSNCSQSEQSTSLVLSGRPCRSLSLRGSRFERNTADGAGGAVLASNLKHVHFSSAVEDNAEFNFQTLEKVADGENFMGNRIGESGYGSNVAGSAVRLNIRNPILDNTTGLLVENQSSGQSNPLPPIQIELLDELGQIISAGIVDSVFPIRADSRLPGIGSSIVSGQVVSRFEKGVAVFNALSLSAPVGSYEVVFSIDGDVVESARGNVTIRECSLGERHNLEGLLCESCPFESFTLYTNVSSCVQCPENARCSGNASLVPVSGYWQSSPFSVIMHDCFHIDACAYGNRTMQLEMARDGRLDEFFGRFDAENLPAFVNSEYPLCAEGYEGPLCGSCSVGYGQLDDKSCVKCNSNAQTVLVVLLMGFLQLFLLSATIHGALVSSQGLVHASFNREHRNDLAQSSTRQVARWRLILRYIVVDLSIGIPRSNTTTPGGVRQNGSPRNQNTSVEERPAQGHDHSVTSILAAQIMSDTIKIFVNFLQITTVANDINPGWPSSMKGVFLSMKLVAGFSSNVIRTPISCLVDTDSKHLSMHATILQFSLPVCLTLLVLSFITLRWFYLKISPTFTPSESRQYLWSRVPLCLLVAWFFAYESLSNVLMGILSCVRLDSKHLMETIEVYDDPDSGVSYSQFSIAREKYWVRDTNIECLSGNHAYLAWILGIPGICVFLVGAPLFLFVFLFKKKQQDQLSDTSVLGTYGFIYQNYKDQFVCWEIMIVVRKALISIILVFGYPLDSRLQGILAQGVLVFALALHLLARPFEHLPLNVFEGFSLFVSFLTFFFGTLFSDENTSHGIKVALPCLLIVCYFVLCIIFFVAVLSYIDRFIYAKLLSNNVPHIPSTPFSRVLHFFALICRNVVSRFKSLRRRNRN